MKIEWWCDVYPNGWADICVTFDKGGARWTVPTDLTAQERELVLKSMCEHAHAVPLAVVRPQPAEVLVFPAPPDFEHGGIELDIFYPQGLFKLPEPKRWLVIHDGCGKQLKFKPPVGKGPRGRWG